jgi:hypothetical protein
LSVGVSESPFPLALKLEFNNIAGIKMIRNAGKRGFVS